MEVESERFWSKVAKAGPDECWLWTAGMANGGYGYFMSGSRTDGSAKMVRAHRYSMALANGPIPSGMEVRHKCDVPACVNPAHLELGTHADNMRDMAARGRSAYGEASGHAKLTDSQRDEVCAKCAAGRSHRSVAVEYGVSRSAVSRINATWRRR